MKSGRARSSIRLLFSALRSFYQFLVVRNILDSNVIKTIEIPKKEKQLPRFLTHSQIESFLAGPEKSVRQKQAPAWMASRDEAIFELFYSSGLRLAELVRLEVRDLDPISETVRVFGKGAKERICPVGLPALEAISRYRHNGQGARGSPLYQQVASQAVGAFCLACDEKVSSRIRPASGPQSAQASSQLRHASARQRRRFAERSIPARPRQPLHNTDLHSCHGGKAQARLFASASESVSLRRAQRPNKSGLFQKRQTSLRVF